MAMARAEAEMVMFESVRQVLAACSVAARQARRLRSPGLRARSAAAKQARWVQLSLFGVPRNAHRELAL
jgi:hypothetical protein